MDIRHTKIQSITPRHITIKLWTTKDEGEKRARENSLLRKSNWNYSRFFLSETIMVRGDENTARHKLP
jgi:hypothetical protein